MNIKIGIVGNKLHSYFQSCNRLPWGFRLHELFMLNHTVLLTQHIVLRVKR